MKNIVKYKFFSNNVYSHIIKDTEKISQEISK